MNNCPDGVIIYNKGFGERHQRLFVLKQYFDFYLSSGLSYKVSKGTQVEIGYNIYCFPSLRDNPGLLMDEVHGFTVPEWLIAKMKVQMAAMRSDAPKQTKNRSRSATPNATTQVGATVSL